MAKEHLLTLRRFHQARILDAIERNLLVTPELDEPPRKRLRPVAFTHAEPTPVWQLRVGEYRVFYDVNRASGEVLVRAIRQKGRRTTGETL